MRFLADPLDGQVPGFGGEPKRDFAAKPALQERHGLYDDIAVGQELIARCQKRRQAGPGPVMVGVPRVGQGIKGGGIGEDYQSSAASASS